MILVGSGALIWRATAFAIEHGTTVDAVVHPHSEAPPASLSGVPCVGTDDVDSLARVIDEKSSDRLVCSTGNPFIFGAPVLDLDLTIVNVHGGPLPAYRGLPIAAASYAILRGEHEFGVTLHRVDAGIDTGAVLDRISFDLDESVTLEELSMQVTDACHDIFVANIDDLGREPATGAEPGAGDYFGRRRLAAIGEFADHPNFGRATDLGELEDFYPEYAELFAAATPTS